MRRCQHTLHAFDDQGRITGSWKVEEHTNEKQMVRKRVVCRCCGKFYGYIGDSPKPVGKSVQREKVTR